MIKKIGLLVVAFALLLSTSAVAFAADLDTPESPIDVSEYQNVDSAYATCSIVSGTANAGFRVTGKAGVTKIEVTYTLQKKSGGSWSKVASWNKNANASVLSGSSSKAVSKGYTYRTKASIKVYKNGAAETITVYSPNVSY